MISYGIRIVLFRLRTSPLVDNSQAEVATGRAEITAPAKRASDSEGGDAGLRQPVVEPVVEPISAIVAADNDPKAIEAEELAAAQGQTNTDDRNEHILKSMPPAILKNLKVDYPVHNEVSGQYESEKVSAKDALKSIDEDIETYKSLLNCTRASE